MSSILSCRYYKTIEYDEVNEFYIAKLGVNIRSFDERTDNVFVIEWDKDLEDTSLGSIASRSDALMDGVTEEVKRIVDNDLGEGVYDYDIKCYFAEK